MMIQGSLFTREGLTVTEYSTSNNFFIINIKKSSEGAEFRIGFY